MEPVGCVQQGSDRSGTVPCAAPPPMRKAHTWPCARRGCRCSRVRRPCKPRTRLPQPVAGGSELPTCKQTAESKSVCMKRGTLTLSRLASHCDQRTVHRIQHRIICKAGRLSSLTWVRLQTLPPSLSFPKDGRRRRDLAHPASALGPGTGPCAPGRMHAGWQERFAHSAASSVLHHDQLCSGLRYSRSAFEGPGQRPAENSSRAIQTSEQLQQTSMPVLTWRLWPTVQPGLPALLGARPSAGWALCCRHVPPPISKVRIQADAPQQLLHLKQSLRGETHPAQHLITGQFDHQKMDKQK